MSSSKKKSKSAGSGRTFSIKNLKMRTRLIIAFLLVAVLMLATLLFAINTLRSTVTSISDSNVETMVEPLKFILEARVAMGETIVKGLNIVFEPDPFIRDVMFDDIFGKIAEIRSNMEDFGGTIRFEASLNLHAEIMQDLYKYSGELEIYRALIDSGEDAAAYYAREISPLSDDILQGMTELNRSRLTRGNDVVMEDNENRLTSAINNLIIITVIGLALTIIFGTYFSISNSKPIIMGSKIIKVVATGDFTAKFPENYGAEFGEFFATCNQLLDFNRSIIDGLRESAHLLRDSASKLTSVSTQMESNSKVLSDKTSSVSSVTEEFSAGMTQSTNSLSTASSHVSAVASSIEEINATISTVAAAAEETSTMVAMSNSLVDDIQVSITKATDSVMHVSSAFSSVAGSVDEISKSIDIVSEQSKLTRDKMADADIKAKNTNEIIKGLEDSSKQISKIVTVINDIADQTNMLALNAAIEAAGAGEAGKGFMVVANEVKELAKQTTEATFEIADQVESMQNNMPVAVGAVSEITTLINGMTEYINSFSQEMERQGIRSDQITEESVAAAKEISDITSEMNSISEKARSVTKAVTDSTRGVNEIAKSTAELVLGTQEISMNSERASNNMNEINNTAREMTSGLVDISKNIHLLNDEAGEVNERASYTKEASESILKIAGEMEESVSRFITS